MRVQTLLVSPTSIQPDRLVTLPVFTNLISNISAEIAVLTNLAGLQNRLELRSLT